VQLHKDSLAICRNVPLSSYSIVNILINKFVYNLIDDYPLHLAHFACELVSLKENTVQLSNDLVCSRHELDKLI